MEKLSVQINSKEERYKYLDSLDFSKYKNNKYDCVHFLIKYTVDSKEYVEPVYFWKFDDWYLEYPCTLFNYNESLEDYINFHFGMDDDFNVIKKPLDSYEKELVEYEKQFQIGDVHYEIEHFQCLPFLPEKIEIIGILTEKECLEYLINEGKKHKEGE